MRTTRIPRRPGLSPRARRAATAVAALATAGAFVLPSAQAVPSAHGPAGHPAPAVGSVDAGPATAAQLTRSLGATVTAGAYYDADARATVVNVTTTAAADAVRAAGAVPRHVAFSSASLREAAAAVRALDLAGTAWAQDPRADQLVVTADSALAPAALTRLRGAATGYGAAVRLERATGRLQPLISGGDAVLGGGYRCSAGFNVHDGITHYFLTAGHCGKTVSTWYADEAQNTKIGPTIGYTFPRHDYALVRYDDADFPHPAKAGDQDIMGADEAYVGQRVTRRGSSTGVHTGTVSALDASVDYGDGDIVDGLIKTDVCAEGGDSGGPLYAGETALGLTSGGNGDCSSGGTTFFQPVTAALSHYGVSLD